LAAAVKLHKENPETTVFSAKIHHCFTWILKQKKWEPLFQSLIAREPRQTQPLTVAENGAFWVFDKVRFLNFGTRYCGAPVPILTKSYSNYEIDEYEDLVLARSVADRIDKFLPHLTKE
jgi:CMP-N-acetylneuraminic acid synthetase